MNRRRTHFRGRKSGAFTILELVLVLAIVLVLAAVAAPRFAGATGRYRLDSAATKVVADLSYARSLANTTSQSKTILFDVANDRITISGISDLKQSADEYVTDLAAAPYHVGLESADFDGNAAVTFNIHGVPDAGGQIVLGAGGRQVTIVVDAETGRASVQ